MSQEEKHSLFVIFCFSSFFCLLSCGVCGISRSCTLAYKAAQEYTEILGEGKTMMEALDEVKIEFARLSTAHSHVIVLQVFLDAARGVGTPEVRSVWEDLWYCLALSWMDEFFSEFLIGKSLSPDHHESLMKALKSILRKIRPNAVAIVDAFWIPDQLLNSALGRYVLYPSLISFLLFHFLPFSLSLLLHSFSSSPSFSLSPASFLSLRGFLKLRWTREGKWNSLFSFRKWSIR